MCKVLGEAVETALNLKLSVANANHCEILIAPVFVHLKTVADRLEGSNIKLAGQNCSTEPINCAQTGEVAAAMLRDVGCTHVIIGHSERRQFYSEQDESVNKKASAALTAGLTVLICVGETLSEREAGEAYGTIEKQLDLGLSNLTTSDLESIIIAYEPVWAIGTGRVATPDQAQEMHGFIRRCLEKQHSAKVATATRILYGGSVKSDNIRGLMAQTDIDGALVGGASLDAKSFAEIVNYL